MVKNSDSKKGKAPSDIILKLDNFIMLLSKIIFFNETFYQLTF